MIEERPRFSTERVISIRRLKAGSMFRLVFVGTATVFVPMILFFGVLAFFGAHTVTVSEHYVTGWKGLLVSVVMAPIFTVIFSLFAWVGAYVGVRVYGYFRPFVIEYVPAGEERENQSIDTTRGN